MGGIMDTLFGKPAGESTTSDSESHSGNHAYDFLRGSLSPAVGYVTQSGNMLANLLGVGGGPAQTTALNNFANSGGMDFLMKNMQKSVTSSKAAQGLLQSGSYGTALQDRGYGLASTYLNQYMNNLMDLGKLGLGAAGTISNAGQYSDSQSHSEGEKSGGKDGIFGDLLGAAGAAGLLGGGGGGAGAAAGLGLALSDRRLKKNVKHVHTLSDGLKVYDYEMVYEPGETVRGVMADEVKKLRPWAYVPNMVPGYDGVDYDKLGDLHG